MTVREALMSLSAYPIPSRVIESTALKRGVELDAAFSHMISVSEEYRLSMADIYMWIYLAPNIGQGGQSYSFGDKLAYKRMADVIYKELGTETDIASGGSTYGYKGSRL